MKYYLISTRGDSTTCQVSRWSSVQCLCRQVHIWNIFQRLSIPISTKAVWQGMAFPVRKNEKAWPVKACKKCKVKGCGWTSTRSTVQSDAKQTWTASRFPSPACVDPFYNTAWEITQWCPNAISVLWFEHMPQNCMFPKRSLQYFLINRI